MEEATRKLGPYTLVSKIGRGAFGVVWLAEKRSSIATTRFALKLPRDEDIDLEAFKHEAAIWLQASGHPNVVPMIEADIYDEQVVIVSEYVPEGSLAAWLKEHGGRAPSIEAACELIDGVLSGLAHLHERHIIHRDLKPDNILLQRETPRLADFGIARLLRSGSYSTNISGTLAYMAPEAFDGKRNEQTDVWSAGVIFYQLLAGRLPYDQTDTASFVGAIMRHDAPPLPDSVPEVLRQIVTKAVQRDPAKRYATAKEMRRDLREAEHKLWQQQQRPAIIEPVAPLPTPSPHQTVPYPPSAPTQKLIPALTPNPVQPIAPPVVREKKTSHAPLWLAGIAGALLLGIFFAVGIYVWVKLSTSEPTPPAEGTKQARPLANTNKAAPPATVKRPVGSYVLQQTLIGHQDTVKSVAFSPDGKTLASASYDDTAKLWDVQTGALKQTLTGFANRDVNSVAFSPDGTMLATGSDDKTIKLWNPTSGTLQQTLTGHSAGVGPIAFSPDGRILASAGYDKTLRLWNVQTGALLQTLTEHSDVVSSVRFSPDGKTLASTSHDKTVRLWDAQTGALQQTLTGHTDFVRFVAFSPDGMTLASASHDDTVKMWDAQTGALLRTLTEHRSDVNTVAFSPDGTTLASGSDDQTIKLWDAKSGALKQTLTGHTGLIWSVVFSPDGMMLASGGGDKTVKLWQAE